MARKLMTRGQLRRKLGIHRVELQNVEPDMVKVVTTSAKLPPQQIQLFDPDRVLRLLEQKREADEHAAQQKKSEQIQHGLEQWARVEAGELITADEVKAAFDLHGRDLGNVRKIEAYHPDKKKLVTYYDRAHAERLAIANAGKGLMTKTKAMNIYKISRKEIEQFDPLIEAKNPHYRTAAPMLLYSVDEIEAYVNERPDKS
jgi:hypothetical protein